MLPLFFISAGLLIIGLLSWYIGSKWRLSEEVDGIIVVSELVTSWSENRDEEGKGLGYGNTMYEPKIEYEYLIGQEIYRSKRISIENNGGCSSSRRAWAENLLKKYPNGAGVRVHVHPSKRNVSMLEPGPTRTVYIFITVGVLCFAAASVLTALTRYA